MDLFRYTNASFWQYLSQTQKDLVLEGEYLTNKIIKDHAYQFKDYSFLIFPFAKAYEGFLKQLFRDIKFISHLDYISDHLRLGKLLSPHLVTRLMDRSLYAKIVDFANEQLAQQIWRTWKEGRNEVFHYFPHNLRAVSFEDAEKTIKDIMDTMSSSYEQLKTVKIQKSLERFIN